jgi:hypothetical protein
MSLAGGWLLAPLVLVALICGCGLLAERVSGRRLPGAVVAPVGLTVLIALAGLFALLDATAELAAPAVVLAAAAGLALSEPWKDPRLRAAWPWPLVVALGAYAVYAAPSLLTGQGSITGYVKLDDSATWLALTDHVLEFGRDRSAVPPGSYARTLEAWLGGDYPVGAFLPLGISARVAGVDPASSYQATIAVYAAVLALGLFAIARSLVTSRAAAALCALAAVQASLLFGYANWGGIKEVCAAALLPPLAWLAHAAWKRDGGRELALLCVAAGATFGVLGLNGLAWAAPALAAGAIGHWRAGGTRIRALGVAAGVLAVASVPALATSGFLRNTTQGAISAQEDLGNLAKPLSLLQGAGLWPTGDLRVDPDPRLIAVLLALACLAGTYGAVAVAVKRRSWLLPLTLGVVLAGTLPALAIGSPWVDAKALAVLAPFVLLAAAAFAASRPLPFAVAGGAVIAVAVAWSTQLVIRDVFVAPRERLAELRTMADGATGPLVQLDFEIYGNRHFLRAFGTDGATDLRQRQVAKVDGSVFPSLGTAEVDEVAPAELWAFQGIVRRRNPVASRPPSAFARARAGDSFERWQRPADAPPPVERMPLATGLDPTGIPDCERLRAMSQSPEVRELAAVVREPPVLADLDAGTMPAPWRGEGVVTPVVDGTAKLRVNVPRAGRWRVYVGGSALGRLEVRVDGRRAGTKRHELAHDGQWLRFAAVQLTAGEHEVELRYSAGPPQGGIGAPSPLGPIALAPEAAEGELPVTRLPPRRYRELCDGRRLDWVEALR